MYMTLIIVIYMFSLTCGENDRPIIGVLAQESFPSHNSPGDTYIPLTYVDYIESAGARVAPIRVKESDEYYEKMFNSINGLLFPGGGVSLTDSEFAKAGRKFYKMALEANAAGDYFPLWGTCQGFELLAVMTAGHDIMADCADYDISLPLRPLPGSRESRLLRGMPDDLYMALITQNITANFHHKCLTPKNFTASVLHKFYQPLSSNVDKHGLSFLSMIEAFEYPFYATQFHPEKNNYQWSTHVHTSHTATAVRMSQYFANFFISEARKSNHHFPNLEEESDALIYNYQTVYNGAPSFEVNYYFNFSHNASSTHHTPAHAHHIPHADVRVRSHRCFQEQGVSASSTPVPMSLSVDSLPLILMGLGMMACLFVGLQLGRCLEAHSHSETWPDVLSWMLYNQRPLANNRRPLSKDPGPSGQRVRLLHTDKHYFTMEDDQDSDM